MGIEGPGGKDPKIPGSGATEAQGPDAVSGPEQKQADFGQAVEGAERGAEAAGAEPPPGIDEVRRIAGALRSGEIATREEAITRACETMLATTLKGVPQATLQRAAVEVARVAREDPTLRARVGRLLDRLAQED